MTSQRESKERSEFFSSNILWLLILIFLSLLVHNLQIKVHLTQFCVNYVKTGEKGLKILKLAL